LTTTAPHFGLSLFLCFFTKAASESLRPFSGLCYFVFNGIPYFILWAHLDCLNRWERSAASGSHQKSASAMSPTQSVRGDQQKLLRCPCGKGQLVRDHSHPGSATAASQPQLIGRRRQQQTAGSNNGYYLMGSSGGGGVGSYNSPTDMLNKRLRNLSNSSSHGGFGAA
uniref:Frizzled domain-containing protein n=1 Tax=Macrostomum lignano TaxID=282301 RepID=A0A1I8G1D2_9PLAT